LSNLTVSVTISLDHCSEGCHWSCWTPDHLSTVKTNRFQNCPKHACSTFCATLYL